jgi:hypothetical protein
MAECALVVIRRAIIIYIIPVACQAGIEAFSRSGFTAENLPLKGDCCAGAPDDDNIITSILKKNCFIFLDF